MLETAILINGHLWGQRNIHLINTEIILEQSNTLVFDKHCPEVY